MTKKTLRVGKTSFVESKNGNRNSGARRETKILGSPREQVVCESYFENESYIWDEILIWGTNFVDFILINVLLRK